MDLQKWLDCTWTAGMIPSCSAASLVPELQLSCVAGNGWCNQTPDIICPVRNNLSAGLAAIVAIGPKNDGAPYSEDDRRFADALCGHISGLLSNARLARKISEDLVNAAQTKKRISRPPGKFTTGWDHCGPSQFPGLKLEANVIAPEGWAAISSISRRADRMNFRGHRDCCRERSRRRHHAGRRAGIGADPGQARRVSAPDCKELNRTLWELSPEDSFTSLLCAQINPSRKCLRYINAGHEPALLLRRGTDDVDRLDSTGAILGLSHRSSYRELTVAFEPGDILAAFTDGIAESTGPGGVVRILREGLDSRVSEMASSVLTRRNRPPIEPSYWFAPIRPKPVRFRKPATR